MSKSKVPPKTSGQPKKATAEVTPETQYKNKYKQCNDELKKATKTIDSLKKDLQDCQFDLLSVQANFNYDEVRKKLPPSMDNDGLLRELHARLIKGMTELEKDREQFEHQKQQHPSIHNTSNQHTTVNPPNSDNRIQELQRENQNLKENMQEHVRRIERLEDVKSAKERLEQEMTELKKKIKRFEEENKAHLDNAYKEERPDAKLEEENATLKSDLAKARVQRNQEADKQDTSISHTDIAVMKKKHENELNEKEIHLEDERRKCSELNINIEVLKKAHTQALRKMESDLEDTCKEILRLQRDSEDRSQEILSLQREMKDLQAKHKALEKQLEEEKKNIQKDMNDLQAKHKALEKQLEEEKKDIQKLKESRPRTGNSKEKELTEEIGKLKTRLKEVQSQTSSSKERELMEQNENLKTRLSQMAGAQLMANTPNIADLSDANRPKKLAEHYTDLYDNEWNNAYEVLEENGKSELQIIQTLYALLKETYTFCIRVSTEQIRHLKLAVTSVLQRGEPPSDNNIDITKLRQLRDLRKTFAPDVIESVFQYYKQEKKPRDIDKPAMKEFIHKCITLCWLMNVQNPPVVVDIKPHAGSFNGDIFQTYTKTGKTVDYVVWPPLNLHEGGPMLSKGIAQGK